MVKRDEYLLKLAIASLGVAAAVIIAAVMIYLKKPEPQGYAVFPDSRIVPLVSIQDEADSVKVAHFASSCILQGFNFDFRNYNTQLAKMNTCMSDDGYVSFNNAVQSLLDVVKQKRLVMVTDIIEPTVVIKTAVVDGVRKYRTRTIVLISFDGQNSRVEPVRWVVEAVMNNVPLSKKASGLESTSINAKPYVPTKS